MFGLVMILGLVLLTVAPPFAFIALTRQKPRHRDDTRDQ
jgi:hypothetical protein